MARHESLARREPPLPGTSDMTSTQDESLARRLRDGDVDAFDALVRDVWQRLVYYLIDRVRVRELAEDLAQEALARLWQHRANLEPTRSVRSYLYQIARNLATDELRRLEVQNRWRAMEEARRRWDVDKVTPLRRVENREAMEALREALDQLPQRRREAFTLVHVQQLSHREAAEVMGTSPQTVANQVAAALAALRIALRPYIGGEA